MGVFSVDIAAAFATLAYFAVSSSATGNRHRVVLGAGRPSGNAS